MPLSSKLVLKLCLLIALLASAAGAQIHAETFRNPRRIPLAVDPFGVTTGDLNGDGRSDIVWTELLGYPNIPLLHVLLAGVNGQYSSAPDVSFPFVPTAIQCVIEDVTGDKLNDLVCVAASNNYVDTYLLTYLGKGDGTFGPAVQTKLAPPVTLTAPILGRAGDLNGDRLSDVIVTDGYYSMGLPYLSDGQGGFKPAPMFSGSVNYSVPTVADLNGDGKLDVIWPNGPRVLIGNGDGTFAAPVAYDPGFLSQCAFGDVDHDGHLDAVCTWLGSGGIDGMVTLSVLHGNPDGTFNKTAIFTRTFGTGDNEFDGFPTILAPVLIADLNGDGYADIVSRSGDGYCVLLGGPNATWNGQPQQFVAASSDSEFGVRGIYGVSIDDMNGDGVPDIVAIGPNGLYITYAQPDGTLSSAPAPEVGEVSTSVTLVDVNGDGNLDAVSSGDTALKLSLGRGDGTFNPPQAITTTANFGFASHVAVGVISGDFNGDGKQDLIAIGVPAVYTAQPYILFGHGDGTFDNPVPVSLPAGGKVIDLNGDGLSDIVSVQNNASATNVLVANLSRGDGTFTTVSTSLPVESANYGYIEPFSGPVFADFRHSGQRDVALTTRNNAYLLRGHGDGSFDSTGTPLLIPNLPNLNKTGASDVATGDFDGDGKPDIAVLVLYGNGPYNFSTTTSAAWIFYGNGDGTFASAVLAGTFNRAAQTLTAGDLNGDGLTDLVLTSYEVYQYNGVLITHALPNRTWGAEVDYTGGEGLQQLWITDINHDGRNDLIFSNAGRLNYASNSISVLLNQLAASVTGSVTATPEPSNVTYPFTLHTTLIPSNAGDILSGTVVFSLDGTVVGSGTLSGNAATLSLSGTGVAAGSHTLSAAWTGNSTYPALTLNGTHTVNLLPVKIVLTAAPNLIVNGVSVVASTVFTPFPVPNQPGYQFTGIMTLFDNGVAIAQQQVSKSGFNLTLTSLAVGAHTLSVSYAGDPIFAATQSNSATVTVTGALSTATLTATPTVAAYGTTISLTAKVAAATSGVASIPTGPVTFAVDGVALAPVPLTNSVATTVVSNLIPATHTMSCTYAGDATFGASACNTVPVTINPAASALTITSSQNPSVAYAPVTFTMHLTLNGLPAPAGSAFTFSLMGNSSNVTLTTDATGTATYTTSQLFARIWDTVAIFSAGNYVTSSTHYAQVVTAAATTLTLTASPNPSYTGQAVTFSASATPSGSTFPTGSVTFSDSGIVLGAGMLGPSGQAIFSTSTLAVGTHTIIATYAGDPGFSAASSPTVAQVVLANGFTLALSPASLSIKGGADGTVLIQLGSLGNFVGPLKLTVGTPPTYASTSLSASSVTLTVGGSGSSTLTIHTLALSGHQRPDQSGPPNRFNTIVTTSLAGLLICSLLPTRPKARRRLRHVLLVLLTLLPLASTTGCLNAWYTRNFVAVGAYSLPITATDATGRAQTATLTLTITP